MKKMSSFSVFAASATALLATVAPASANNVLFSQSSAFPSSGTATQTGRLNRNAIPQDFSGSEAYPGLNTTAPNNTATFNYITITLTPAQLAGGPYVQIELDTQGTGLFASAYADAYNPVSASNPNGNFQTNYLGDQGSSGNYNFTTLPIPATSTGFFGVTVPLGSSLVIVLSTSGTVDTSTGIAAGAGTPYNILVENFSSVSYANAVPEPSSYMAVGAGLLALGGFARRRAAKQAV